MSVNTTVALLTAATLLVAKINCSGNITYIAIVTITNISNR